MGHINCQQRWLRWYGSEYDWCTQADYCEGGELDRIVKTIIEKMATVEKLVRLHDKHKKSTSK